MRRRNLLIILLLSVAIWALSVPDNEDALAKDTENVLCSTRAIPASAFIDDDDKVYEQSEPAETGLTVATDPIPSGGGNQPEPPTLNETHIDKQPALSETEVSRLRKIEDGNQEAVVAILDTGIDQNHEELCGQIIAEANFTESPTPDDIYGHGTPVAGIIAAKDSELGVASGCSLLNVKVADDAGRCRATALAEGIIWAVDNGASVLNISIEIGEPSPDLEKAVDYAWSHGSLIIAAAGNSGTSSPAYPAYYENCLAVGATNQDGELALLSNHGDWVDVLAPGFDIYSTLPDNEYGYKSGTSFACAYVSGMAALLFDVVTDVNGNGRCNDEVRAIIESGCQEADLTRLGT